MKKKLKRINKKEHVGSYTEKIFICSDSNLSYEDIVKMREYVRVQESELQKNSNEIIAAYRKIYEIEKEKINKYFDDNEAIDQISSRSLFYLIKAKLGIPIKRRKSAC